MPNFDAMIEIIWTSVWLIVFLLGIWQLHVVTLDWKAIVRANIKNGRRLIAKSNLAIIVLLVLMAVFNIIPGINALLTPPGVPVNEFIREVNISAHIISALLCAGVLAVKRASRTAWNRSHTGRKN